MKGLGINKVRSEMHGCPLKRRIDCLDRDHASGTTNIIQHAMQTGHWPDIKVDARRQHISQPLIQVLSNHVQIGR